MAVEAFKTTQVSGYKASPIEAFGKIRYLPFSYTPSVTGDDGTTIELCHLPFRARVLPHMSKIFGQAFGAARVLKVGHAAYEKIDGTTEPANLSAFGSALDVSAATNDVKIASTFKYDITSKKGVTVMGQITGGTWPSGVKLEGYIALVVE